MEETGIPKVVTYQAINFFGLAIILFFVVRGKVSGYFTSRHEKLTAALNEAKRLKEDAEKKHQEYVVKIQALERDAQDILTQIRREGEESKKRMIAEAEKMAQTIQAEAKRAAENEAAKAKAELYDEVLSQALDGARGLLAKTVVEKDQRRLQKEFVEKIEAVQ